MKKFLLVGVALLPCMLSAETEVSVAGVQVVYEAAGKEFGGFKTLNGDEGHKVVLIVRTEEKNLVGYLEEDAKLTIGGAAAEAGFFMRNTAISESRKAMRLEFQAKGGAKTNEEGALEVKGVLPLVYATGKEEVRSEPFEVKKGVKIVFAEGKEGLPALKVSKTGKPQWGDRPLQIDFSTNRKMDEFAGVKFLTKDGKEIDCDRGGSSWMGSGRIGKGTVTYSLDEKHDELIMVLEMWTGREEKNVEVDVKVKLGGK